MRPRCRQSPWSILVAIASTRACDDEFIAVPFGFSARVIDLACRFQRPAGFLELAASYTGRALAAAWSLAACSIILGYDQIIECFV